MFAVIETGGKQLRVEEGQTYFVEKLNGKVGDEVVFDKVLLVSGDSVKVGSPLVEGAKVVAKITKEGKTKKVIVFKYKAKANYRRTQGHRQPYTQINVVSIKA